MAVITFDYKPQPRQALLHSSCARQIFYGGAAGGGKSHALRWDQITFALRAPGLQAYLFRRTLPELDDNHIKFIRREIPSEVAIYHESRKVLEFKNGSAMHFCYCEKEADVYRYLGAEMHHIGIDEASRMTEAQIQLLRTRLRLGGWRPPPELAHALPRMVLASNPGGPAHNFLKLTFVDREPEKVFFDESMRDPSDPNDRGWTSLFIPAKIADNAYIDRNYAASFSGLPPELARAYRDGDWDAVVGQALHTLSKERHMLRPFKPPAWWTKFMSLDWGSAKPFSVGWYCVSEGAWLEAKDGYPRRWLPEGAVIRYAEWYGWNGRANQGIRLDSPAVARQILQMEQERGDVIDYRVADSEIWSKSDGPSTAERMMAAGADDDPDATRSTRFALRPAKKDRKHNYSEVLARLAGNPNFRDDGQMAEDPMFFVTANCRHFWRTVPTLSLDETDPEKGPDTDLEDHVYDEVAYALRSRPYVTTEQDRKDQAEAEYIRHMRNADPYAVRRTATR